jgi:excisionase family DNA binding protein
MSVDRLLTPAELAAHLRASERTVARMVADGCPSMLVGKRRRFDLAKVTAWMEERAQCQSEKTPKVVGTPRSASIVDAFTERCRRVQLRPMRSS